MNASGQFYEIKGGINFTGFYKGEKTSDDTYQFKPGYVLGISVGDLTSHRLMFTLKIDNIKAYYHNVHQSTTGTGTYEVHIDKTNLALDAYFINLRFLKYFSLNMGLSAAVMINDNTSGLYTEERNGRIIKLPVESGSDGIHKSFTVGYINRLAGDIKISESWYLVPQVMLYVGLADEFKDNTADMKDRTLRPYIEIGFRRAFASTPLFLKYKKPAKSPTESYRIN
jgi:hypothetical protein